MSDNSQSVYPEPTKSEAPSRNILSIIVDNEPGILSRIVGLFSGRGYNIEALNVTVVNQNDNLSRITIESYGKKKVISQIISQLEKLVPVHSARNLASYDKSFEAEICLVKILLLIDNVDKKLNSLADIYRARIVYKEDKIVIYEISGTSERVNKFLSDLSDISGITTEIVRSGPIGLGQ